MRILSCTAPLAFVLLLPGCLIGPDSAPNLPLDDPERQNLVVVGAGLGSPPAVLEVVVPVSSPAAIVSAKFRWVRRGPNSTGDNRILINSRQYTGTLVSSYDVGGDTPWVFFYELDARAMLRPGRNRFFVSRFALPAPERADGIGLVVLYEDPDSPWTEIHLLEPQEFVHAATGAPWEFPIGAATGPRNARFLLFAGDCTASGTDRVWWSTESGAAARSDSNVLVDRLTAAQGPWMDVLTEDLAVPGEATTFVYQLESPADGTGDSILHFFGALCIDGESLTCTGRIAGRVWQDDDRDGLQDDTEPGLGGVSVTLTDGLDAVVATAETDPGGAFSFAPLCAGDYLVTVEESSLPAGLEPTTCATGDCSPRPVSLPSDDATVDGLAFGWGFPPEPPACTFDVSFWKNEYGVLAGVCGGESHFDEALLRDLLVTVEALTSLDWTGGDGTLDAADAYATLSLTPVRCSPCQLAQRDYLACLLNFALNEAVSDLPVDTDGDGTTDTTFGQAIASCETLFAAGTSEDCEQAQAIAASINAMPDDGCAL